MDGQGMKRTRVVARASSLQSLKDSAAGWILLVMSLDPTLESAHSYISHLLLTDFGLRLSIPVLSLAFGSMGNNMVRWATILVGWAIILVGVSPTLVEWAPTLVEWATTLAQVNNQGKQVTTDPNNHLNQFNNEGSNKFIQGNEGRQVYNQGNEKVNNHGDNYGNQFNNQGNGGNQFNNQGNEGRQVYNQGNGQVDNQGNGQVDNHGNKQGDKDVMI